MIRTAMRSKMSRVVLLRTTTDRSGATLCNVQLLHLSTQEKNVKNVYAFAGTTYSIAERETTQAMILFKWFLNGCQI